MTVHCMESYIEGFNAALEAVLMVIENEPDYARVVSLRKEVSP